MAVAGNRVFAQPRSNSAVRVAWRLVEEAQRLCEVLAQIVAKVLSPRERG